MRRTNPISLRKAGLLGLLALFTLQPGFTQNNKKPNIIFILADDLGYGETVCYGQEKIATPNIDALAQKGMRFTQFYAGTSVCAPSRASLMTGMHSGHIPVRGNKGMKPEGQFPLPDSILTIANMLQKYGYSTAAFGKWGLGFITTSGDPQKKGFELFFGYNCQTLAHNYYPDHLWHDHKRINFPENKDENAVYSADIIHRRALEFLGEKHAKPFFLYLTYTLPHGDVIAPQDSIYDFYINKFEEAPIAEKRKRDDSEEHRFEPYPHAAFASMVTRLDNYVGDVMQALKAKGIENNTLVIFTSDNGPHSENGGDPGFFNSSGGLRGIKRDLYEGGIRVPFIAYWKNHVRAGTTTAATFAFWDIYPTLLQLAGAPLPRGKDGISILPLLLGKKQTPHEDLYWEFHEDGGKQAVRWGTWKGIRLNVNKNAASLLELYDLAKDPTEKNNVAAQNPEIVKQIEKRLRHSHVKDPNWPLLPGEGELK